MLLDRLLRVRPPNRDGPRDAAGPGPRRPAGVLAIAARGLPALAIAGALACTARPDPPDIEAPPAVAPAPDRSAEAPFQPVPEARELAITRTQCFGTCPDYTAIVDAYGRVWYFGRMFAPRTGLHTGRVAPAAVHAVFRRAIERGYLEAGDDYDGGMTDQPTVYTSVTLERRTWVRDYAQAAPPAVLELEEAIDALVAGTVWDAAPAVEPAPAHACADLARALAQRCRPYLELRGPREDCPYFFARLDALGEHRQTDGERAVQCAAYLRSLARTPTPAPTEDRPQLGPACARWLTRGPEACLAALRAGETRSPACRRIARSIASFRGFSRAVEGDEAAGLRAAEAWCEFRLSP